MALGQLPALNPPHASYPSKAVGQEWKLIR